MAKKYADNDPRTTEEILRDYLNLVGGRGAQSVGSNLTGSPGIMYDSFPTRGQRSFEEGFGLPGSAIGARFDEYEAATRDDVVAQIAAILNSPEFAGADTGQVVAAILSGGGVPTAPGAPSEEPVLLDPTADEIAELLALSPASTPSEAADLTNADAVSTGASVTEGDVLAASPTTLEQIFKIRRDENEQILFTDDQALAARGDDPNTEYTTEVPVYIKGTGRPSMAGLSIPSARSEIGKEIEKLRVNAPVTGDNLEDSIAAIEAQISKASEVSANYVFEKLQPMQEAVNQAAEAYSQAIEQHRIYKSPDSKAALEAATAQYALAQKRYDDTATFVKNDPQIAALGADLTAWATTRDRLYQRLNSSERIQQQAAVREQAAVKREASAQRMEQFKADLRSKVKNKDVIAKTEQLIELERERARLEEEGADAALIRDKELARFKIREKLFADLEKMPEAEASAIRTALARNDAYWNRKDSSIAAEYDMREELQRTLLVEREALKTFSSDKRLQTQFDNAMKLLQERADLQLRNADAAAVAKNAMALEEFERDFSLYVEKLEDKRKDAAVRAKEQLFQKLTIENLRAARDAAAFVSPDVAAMIASDRKLAERTAEDQRKILSINNSIGDPAAVQLYERAMGQTPGQSLVIDNTAKNKQLTDALVEEARYLASTRPDLQAPAKLWAELPSDELKQELVERYSIAQAPTVTSKLAIQRYIANLDAAVLGADAEQQIALFYEANATTPEGKQYAALRSAVELLSTQGEAAMKLPANQAKLRAFEELRTIARKALAPQQVERASMQFIENNFRYDGNKEQMLTALAVPLADPNLPESAKIARENMLNVIESDSWGGDLTTLMNKLTQAAMYTYTPAKLAGFGETAGTRSSGLVNSTPTGYNSSSAAMLAKRFVTEIIEITDQQTDGAIKLAGWGYQARLAEAEAKAKERGFWEQFGFDRLISPVTRTDNLSPTKPPRFSEEDLAKARAALDARARYFSGSE